ncbi:hypothetical protein JL193_09520 [Polaribacter batillariae]|uniref:Uncharacterized protein n=1 Tax=Polaribacter batillariae TaxID=2808900 RepID=A0ABX7SSI4_9FLAO|nr:hypothetical protein [Polaribacter batillariae]QTD36398.1 hypothetical protein JL193_09520 [Polaribacter batillariae]
MRNIFIFMMVALYSACSSEDNSITEPQEEPFTVELVATSTNVNIDEVATFKIE